MEGCVLLEVDIIDYLATKYHIDEQGSHNRKQEPNASQRNNKEDGTIRNSKEISEQ